MTEVVGTSQEGIDQAIRNGVARASKTIDNMDWFEVTGMRGYIRDGAVDHFQVTIKIGSRLSDA